MNVIETRLQSLAWDTVKAEPAYGLGDDRRKGGASSVQVWVAEIIDAKSARPERHR